MASNSSEPCNAAADEKPEAQDSQAEQEHSDQQERVQEQQKEPAPDDTTADCSRSPTGRVARNGPVPEQVHQKAGPEPQQPTHAAARCQEDAQEQQARCQQTLQLSTPDFQAELQQRAQERAQARAAAVDAMYSSTATAAPEPGSPSAASNRGRTGYQPSQRQPVWGTDAYASLWERAKELGRLQEQDEQQPDEQQEQEQGQQEHEQQERQDFPAEDSGAASDAGSMSHNSSQAAPAAPAASDEDSDDATSWYGQPYSDGSDPLERYSITSYGKGDMLGAATPGVARTGPAAGGSTAAALPRAHTGVAKEALRQQAPSILRISEFPTSGSSTAPSASKRAADGSSAVVRVESIDLFELD